jgi:5-(carboxyamino)imidazole ribonucleotide synthase
MTPPIPPGAVIGLIGGGQLARMTALAAHAMGYRVRVLDPDPRCAAAPVADEVIVASLDDVAAARRLARHASVVSYEIESTAPECLHAAAAHAPVRPAAGVLEVVQDRARQKFWLEARGYPVGPWMWAETPGQLALAFAYFGPLRIKRTRGGYDGRSQRRVVRASDAAPALLALGGASVAEQELDLALELSVLVARTPSGAVAAHPPALNQHEEGILRRTVFPAPVDPARAREATALAIAIAHDLGVTGLLAVELFVTTDGRLLVNELAARPHNTFHAAGTACATGQFEQFVRAICGLPLGATEPTGVSVLINLLGDLWRDGPPDLDAALRVPGVALHLYGKEPRPLRKVGHLSVRADTTAEALARADRAERALRGGNAARPADPSGVAHPAGAGAGPP